MPNFSQKVFQMPASPIRKLAPYARKAKEKGIKVYHLNIGQPDIETPENAIQAIKNIDLKVFKYAMSEGNLEYRNALASYYQKIGFTDIKADNFLATNGGSEALLFTIGTICDERDEIIVPEPFYANYSGFAQIVGAKIIPLKSTIESGFALPTKEEFQKIITARTKAILITQPGNPTGKLYSKEELNVLKELALEHDIFIISDEVYREYIYDGLSHSSILEFEELHQHAIVIDSESKRYSMCGLRIGFLVTRNTAFLELVIKYAQARLSPPLLAQIAAAAAHFDNEQYIDNVRMEYEKRRNTLVKLLHEIPDVSCPIPEGAFYCIAKFPVEDTDDFAQWLLDEYQYENQTVMLAPASGFYSNPEDGKNQVRLAYVLNENDLQNAMTVIKHGLEAYKNR